LQQDVGAIAGISSAAGKAMLESMTISKQINLNKNLDLSRTKTLALSLTKQSDLRIQKLGQSQLLSQSVRQIKTNQERTKEKQLLVSAIITDVAQLQATKFKEPPAPSKQLVLQKQTRVAPPQTPQLPPEFIPPTMPFIPKFRAADYSGSFAFGKSSGGDILKEKKPLTKFTLKKGKIIKLKPLYLPTYQNIFLARTAGQKITPLPQKEAKEYFRKTGGLSIPTREQAQRSSGKANLKQKLKGLIGI
jgi:hypothetical protein